MKLYSRAEIIDVEDIDELHSLNEKDIENLKKWGFNLIRLGILWEGLET